MKEMHYKIEERTKIYRAEDFKGYEKGCALYGYDHIRLIEKDLDFDVTPFVTLSKYESDIAKVHNLFIVTEVVLNSTFDDNVIAPLGKGSKNLLDSLHLPVERGKSYKDFEKEYIGSSDIASLILAGHSRWGLKLHDLHFGIDDSYQAYIVNGECEIGEHYRFEAEFYTWLNIYDDDELVKEFRADIIRVYRAGEHGCIIQLLNR